MTRVLLIQSGQVTPALAERFGEFDRWFVRALEGSHVGWTVVRPFRGEALPDASAFDAVLMTGALESVTDGARWMPEAERWIRATVESGAPFLGVCFGHQALAHSFGAKVARNPTGLELGTREVELTQQGRADPLLGSLPARFVAHQTHEDAVLVLPPGLRRLARNDSSPVQAFAAGRRAWGVQFHPEMDEAMVLGLAEAFGRPAPATRPSPAGALLRTFVALID